MILNFKWAPHSGAGTLTPTRDGQLPASQLRAPLCRFRQHGPADTLLPSHSLNSSPELSLLQSSMIHYEMGGGGDATLQPSPIGLTPSSSSSSNNRVGSASWLGHGLCRLACFRGYGTGRNGQMTKLTTHFPGGRGRRGSGGGAEALCLVTTYESDILVCRKTDHLGRIRPSHDWLHAMDADTYPPPRECYAKLPCNDEACMDYYKRRKMTSVCTYRPCLLSLWVI